MRGSIERLERGTASLYRGELMRLEGDDPGYAVIDSSAQRRRLSSFSACNPKYSMVLTAID